VKPAQAGHLSVVVLPFANLSGDPAQEYFADGVTENLTTELSRIRNSIVIARNTAFTYKGRSIDAKEISKELGVRYVLEGSVQRDKNQVRVNAQLIDGETGAHLWADRFEEVVANLFKLQDEVVARLANTLRFELIRAEAQKDAASKDPDAIDFNMRGRALLWVPYTQDKFDAARAWFAKALEIDPKNSDTLAGDAFTYTLEFTFGSRNPGIDYDEKILGPADRATMLDQDNSLAYLAKSFYLLVTSRPDDAFRAADVGLAVDPNSASLLDARSIAETYLRRFEQAKADVQQAMRLSPRDPALSQWRNHLADAEIGLGNYDAAIDACRKAIDGGYRVFTHTSIWRSPTDLRVTRIRQEPPWPKLGASIPNSPSSG
jgi:TolB-like protein